VENPLLQKQWRVSQIEHQPVFGSYVQGLSHAQLDAVLELYSIDYPDRLKFRRAETVDRMSEMAMSMTSWANVLIGKAKDKYLGRFSVNLPFAVKHPNGVFSGPKKAIIPKT
jgi:hypothetical protein